MKYIEFSEENIDVLHYYDNSSVHLLWVNDHYDGMLSGICEVEGQKCFVNMFSESDTEESDWYRKYLLILLDEMQYSEEVYWNNLFKAHVGNHWDHTEEEHAKGNILHSKEKWDGFYKPFNEQYKPNFDNNEILGWYKT